VSLKEPLSHGHQVSIGNKSTEEAREGLDTDNERESKIVGDGE